ncbi:MAG: Ig-like domain-containing protein [Sedimentisphaerales bacterium]
METITKIMKKRCLRRGIIYFLTWCLVLNTSLPTLLAGPTGGDVDTNPINGGGNADITYNTGTYKHTTLVKVQTERTIINWESLDTKGGAVNVRETLAFTQGALKDSAVLNRVISGYGTQFLGDLNAEGMRIFIVNPAGIVFGEGSTVNVTQLIASNLDISNNQFLAGDYEFVGDIEGVDVQERLGVINNGTITTFPGAEGVTEGVALIGQKILNTGTIKTGAGGFVVMAAGDRVLLGEPGSKIVVEMDSVTLSEDGFGNVVNESINEIEPGIIESPEGMIVLAAGDMFSVALELSSEPVRVASGVGRIEQNGTIDTDGIVGDGGQVMLTAADEVILSADSLTKANAGTTGDSGLVVVHSKGDTTVQADAKIEAMGGYVPYDITDEFDDVVDTSVEISGDSVNFAGDVDASASYGKRGKVIIDAMDMTIEDGYMPDTPPDNTVYEKWIEQQSYASTDVELVAHAKVGGNIVAKPISDGVIEGGSGDIVLRTKYDTGGIEFMPGPNGDRTAIHTTQGGNVYMLAGEGGIAIGDIISLVPQHAPEPWIVEPGKIRLLTTNYGDITTGQLSVDGGSYDEISVIASGDLLINGDVTTYAHQVDEDLEVGQARTCLVSEHGDVEINGIITVEAHAKYETTADIHIDAGRDVRIDLGEGQIRATALTSAEGTANASVLIHAGTDPELSGKGNITITNPKSADKAIYLRAQTQGDKTEIYSDGEAPVDIIEVTDGESRAKLELDEKHTDDCPDCPVPPGLDPPLPPLTDDDTATTHMGDSVVDNVLDNDTLPQGGDLTAHVIDEPEHGVLLDFDPETGEYTYQPDDGFVGEDTFTYVATDGELFAEAATVTITVTNTLPNLGDDTATTHMNDAGKVIDVVANDADPDGDAFAVDSFLYEGGGTLIQNEDGTFTYTPPKGFVGEDSFAYTTSDGQDGVSSGSAMAVITVTNALPILGDDAATTHMGDPVSGINVLANDADSDGDAFAVDSFVYQGDGILVQNDDGTFTYTPPKGFVGEDSFIYTTSDGQDGVSSEPAMVAIAVTNALPTLADDTATTDQGVAVTINVLANDFDPEGDLLSVDNFIYEGGGTLVLNDDGTFSFTPAQGFAGQDSFIYSAADPETGAMLSQANVTIIINPALAVAVPFIPPAPGLESVQFDISGCPALVKWAAAELGIDERMMQIWTVNTLASSRDIQPCDACEKLKNVAAILRDDGGTRIAALAQVISELASNTAPPTPEQMASVADVISRNSQANNHYAAAGEYVDALVAYVGVLNNDLAFSTEESIMFAVDKYVAPRAENQNAGMAAYIAARLAALGGS